MSTCVVPKWGMFHVHMCSTKLGIVMSHIRSYHVPRMSLPRWGMSSLCCSCYSHCVPLSFTLAVGVYPVKQCLLSVCIQLRQDKKQSVKWRDLVVLYMLVTHVKSHASAVSVLESGEQRCIKEINNNNNCSPCVHFNLFCVCLADWNKRDKSVTNYDKLFIYVCF